MATLDRGAQVLAGMPPTSNTNLAESRNKELLEMTDDVGAFVEGQGAVEMAAATAGCKVFE